MAGRWLDFRGIPAAGWDAFYAECKRLGYEGVIRYIDAGSDSKQIHRAEYIAAVRKGIKVLLVDELGTGDAWDAANDFAAGQARARGAAADAAREGIPASVQIFCAADAHASSARQISDAVAYARGFASVLGKARSGFYGFSETSRAVHAAGVVALHWRCGSEPPVSERSWIHFWQRNTGTVRILGVECDVNDQYLEITSTPTEDDDMKYDDEWDPAKLTALGPKKLGQNLLNIQQNGRTAAANSNTIIGLLRDITNRVTQSEARILGAVSAADVDNVDDLADALVEQLGEDLGDKLLDALARRVNRQEPTDQPV